MKSKQILVITFLHWWPASGPVEHIVVEFGSAIRFAVQINDAMGIFE